MEFGIWLMIARVAKRPKFSNGIKRAQAAGSSGWDSPEPFDAAHG
jgi:hypothetical protein